MKKRYAIVVAVLLNLLVPAAALAVADGPDHYMVRNVRSDDVLHVRAEPSAKAKIVGAIPSNGKKIVNLGDTFPETRSDMDAPVWCKIKYKDMTGWVACKFLQEDSE